MSDRILKRIHEFHILHPNLEYYGQLVVKTNGKTLEDVEDLMIEAVDFVPYDLGCATYTDVKWDELDMFEIENVIPDWWDREDLELHSVHSHHNMTTGPSNTDDGDLWKTAELQQKGYYIGLIVNHDGKYNCRIAYATNAKGELWQGNKLQFKFPKPAILYADCDVEFEFQQDGKYNYERYHQMYPKYADKYLAPHTPNEEFLDMLYLDFFGVKLKWNDTSFQAMLEHNGGLEVVGSNFLNYFVNCVNTLEAEVYPYKEHRAASKDPNYTPLIVILHFLKESKKLNNQEFKLFILSVYNQLKLG